MKDIAPWADLSCLLLPFVVPQDLPGNVMSYSRKYEKYLEGIGAGKR